MFQYELWFEFKDWECRHTEIAETPGKAKYQFYRYLQDGVWKTDFKTFVKSVKCKKKGIADITSMFGPKAQFDSMCEKRHIPFCYQGMRIEVCGKPGTVVGSTSGLNLQVVFDGNQWVTSNCHPYYETTYYDANGIVVADYCNEKVS
ncbi:hypothetical protein [Bacillus toyonensis]|uniref:hypothetical protein n=1 Tax=Bacillus toyonensis TaxID=155322 RepID=UPI002E243CBC|nr:hypothetical protein [Bacillus toyonensis]